MLYIFWDPPLVLHIANLLTDSIAGHQPGSYLAQGYYCVTAVSLEPAIIRSWVVQANHATRPGQNGNNLDQWANNRSLFKLYSKLLYTIAKGISPYGANRG